MAFSRAMFTVLGVTPGLVLPVDVLPGFSLCLMYGGKRLVIDVRER